jgi:hypothetical protein
VHSGGESTSRLHAVLIIVDVGSGALCVTACLGDSEVCGNAVQSKLKVMWNGQSAPSSIAGRGQGWQRVRLHGWTLLTWMRVLVVLASS